MMLKSLYTHMRGRYDKRRVIVYMDAFNTSVTKQLCWYSNIVRGIKYDDACKISISRQRGDESESNKLIKHPIIYFS